MFLSRKYFALERLDRPGEYAQDDDEDGKFGPLETAFLYSNEEMLALGIGQDWCAEIGMKLVPVTLTAAVALDRD